MAPREGKSLWSVVTESLAEQRWLAALAEVVAWMGEGQSSLTEGEIERARCELAGTRKGRRPRKELRSY